MFKMRFETGNAAFESGTDEVTEILRTVANQVDAGMTAGAVIDSNGNTVGQFELAL